MKSEILQPRRSGNMLVEKVIQSTNYSLTVVLFTVCFNIQTKLSEFQFLDHWHHSSQNKQLLEKVVLLHWPVRLDIRPQLQEFVYYHNSQAGKAFWKSRSSNIYFYLAAAVFKLPDPRRLYLLCLWNELPQTRGSEAVSSSFSNSCISPQNSWQSFALNIIPNVHMHHHQTAVSLDNIYFIFQGLSPL